jgi:hypothetical protein
MGHTWRRRLLLLKRWLLVLVQLRWWLRKCLLLLLLHKLPDILQLLLLGLCSWQQLQLQLLHWRSLLLLLPCHLLYLLRGLLYLHLQQLL